MPRSRHVSSGCYPCSWVCVCTLQTQVSAYSAGSSSWKVWTVRCKSLGARITTCSGENSPFKNRHADYVSTFLISWRVKVPSVSMRARAYWKHKAMLSVWQKELKGLFCTYALCWKPLHFLLHCVERPDKESQESDAVLAFDTMQVYDLG